MSFEREARVACEAAQAGGEVVARHASAEMRGAREKSHDNPVTAADLEADAAIRSVLRAAFPDDLLLSEETADAPERLGAERVWIVDPLDGTKEFVEGVPQFSVSVALALRGQPVAGCVFDPSTGEAFSAAAGSGARLGANAIRVTREQSLAKAVVLSSRTEMKRGQVDAFRPWVARLEPVGSVALKLAWVAAGRADLWISAAPKSEWDVCAGDLLVREAGGTFIELARGPRSYNQADVLLQPPLAAGPESLVREFQRRACPA
ncbi:MAG TPA: 3'(2'),5'-bisphosphate nucleotidase CysQ [Myxococcota bacterium]|nr:3'(2'),5'-bisphosphate nucleotidase CysQ [Myxococcota bacterium]